MPWAGILVYRTIVVLSSCCYYSSLASDVMSGTVTLDIITSCGSHADFAPQIERWLASSAYYENDHDAANCTIMS